jgi:hypothetical protein
MSEVLAKPRRKFTAVRTCDFCHKETRHIVSEYNQDTTPKTVLEICKCISCRSIFEQKKLVGGLK